jgi:hypothetical protein
MDRFINFGLNKILFLFDQILKNWLHLKKYCVLRETQERTLYINVRKSYKIFFAFVGL